MLRVGPWEVESVVTGHYRLDGGAMFGVVPKVVWARVAPADELNRISMTTRALLAVHRAAQRVMLVDTGLGSKWSAEAAERFAIQPLASALVDALARRDLRPEDVTDVVVTHLHFDHAGGMTEWVAEPEGPTRLCFPQATHWGHAAHWRHAHAPSLRDRASFLAADFAALTGSPRLRLLDGESPPDGPPDVAWFVAHGHTPAQLLPVLEGGDEGSLLFVGDVVPMAAHLPVAWVMAYDLDPLRSVADREAIYRRCRDERLRVAFPHDPQIGMARLEFAGDRPRIAEQLG